MLRFSLLILMSLGAACQTAAQTWPDSAVAQAKGSIWTATARRVWADAKLAAPRPPKWRTDTAFQNWADNLKGKDQSGLAEIRQAVLNYGQINLAKAPKLPNGRLTPAQLSDAIVLAVGSGKSKGNKLYRVKSRRLKVDLDSVIALFLKTKSGPGDEISGPETTPVIPPVPLPPNNGGTVTQPTTGGYSLRRLLAVAALGMTLGAALGMLIAIVLRKSLRDKAGLPRPIPATKQLNTAPASANNSTLSQQLKDANRQTDQLRRHNKNLRDKAEDLQHEINRLNKAAALMPTPEPAAVDVAITVAPTAPPLVLYASAISGGRLHHTKLEAAAMDRLELYIQPDPQNPSKATFTLNPGVNPSWLINSGLRRLQDYFDYQEPAATPVSVTSGGIGELHREGDTWQVVTKARLNVRYTFVSHSCCKSSKLVSFSVSLYGRGWCIAKTGC